MHWEGRTYDKEEKFMAVGEACVAIFWPIPALNGRTSVSSGFSTEVILTSASAVPHSGSDDDDDDYDDDDDDDDDNNRLKKKERNKNRKKEQKVEKQEANKTIFATSLLTVLTIWWSNRDLVRPQS